MTVLTSLGARLRRETRGAVAIETALVAPVLILMSVGGFEVSQMVSRQHELQGGAIEAASVALAANQGAETDVVELASLLRESLDLGENEVTVTKLFRCDADSTLVETSAECETEGGNGDNGQHNNAGKVSSYIKIELEDTYRPTWSRLGVGGSFSFHINRMAQIS